MLFIESGDSVRGSARHGPWAGDRPARAVALRRHHGVGAFSLSLTPQALAAERVKAIAPRRQQIIVIDPGHGGIDPGCIGYSGVYEKEIAFSTASEIGRMLEATKRYKVVLTAARMNSWPCRSASPAPAPRMAICSFRSMPTQFLTKTSEAPRSSPCRRRRPMRLRQRWRRARTTPISLPASISRPSRARSRTSCSTWPGDRPTICRSAWRRSW